MTPALPCPLLPYATKLTRWTRQVWGARLSTPSSGSGSVPGSGSGSGSGSGFAAASQCKLAKMATMAVLACMQVPNRTARAVRAHLAPINRGGGGGKAAAAAGAVAAAERRGCVGVFGRHLPSFLSALVFALPAVGRCVCSTG